MRFFKTNPKSIFYNTLFAAMTKEECAELYSAVIGEFESEKEREELKDSLIELDRNQTIEELTEIVSEETGLTIKRIEATEQVFDLLNKKEGRILAVSRELG